MPLVCTDPNFPVPIQLNVINDGSFSTDELWQFSGGWVWTPSGIVATSVTNGVHFRQLSSNFSLSYGSGENEINVGNQFKYSYTIRDQPDNNFGKLRLVWGGNVTSFKRGSAVGFIEAPAGGSLQLAVQSGANTFFGKVTHLSLFNETCRAGTNAEDSGDGGFGSGDGGVGGIIIKGGEEPKTIYSKSLYTDEQIERFREDLLIADELDDTYATEFGSQE